MDAAADRSLSPGNADAANRGEVAEPAADVAVARDRAEPVDRADRTADAADAPDPLSTLRDAESERVTAHRANAVPCPAERGAGISDGPPDAGGGRCGRDADCTASPNGRCLRVASASDGFVPRYACSYDQCSRDSDCASGLACVCRSSGQDPSPNYCALAGNCLSDSDCGPPGYCSFSRDRVCLSGANLGYFCHTPDDECSGEGACEGGGCTYDLAVHHWACSRSNFCVDASQ